MAKDGQVGNRSRLQQAAKLLKMEGVTRFPKDLDLSSIKAIFSIGSLNPGVEGATEEWLEGAVGTLADGLPAAQLQIIGDTGGDPGSIFPQGFRYRVESIRATLQFDAAGATAFNGKYIQFEVFFSGAASYIAYYSPLFQIHTGRLDYHWTLAGGNGNINVDHVNVPYMMRPWSGLVPASESLRVRWVSQDPYTGANTNFPANTNIAITSAVRRSLDDGWPPL